MVLSGGRLLSRLVPTDKRWCVGEEEPLTQAAGCALGGQPRGRGTASAPGWGWRPGQAKGQGRQRGDKELRGMLALRGHHLAAVPRMNPIILQVAFRLETFPAVLENWVWPYSPGGL